MLESRVQRCYDILCLDFQNTKLKCGAAVWLLVIHNGSMNIRQIYFIMCCSIFGYLHGKRLIILDKLMFKRLMVRIHYNISVVYSPIDWHIIDKKIDLKVFLF